MTLIEIELECSKTGLGVIVDDEGVLSVEEVRVILHDNGTANVVFPDGENVDDVQSAALVAALIDSHYSAEIHEHLYLSS